MMGWERRNEEGGAILLVCCFVVNLLIEEMSFEKRSLSSRPKPIGKLKDVTSSFVVAAPCCCTTQRSGYEVVRYIVGGW